MYDGMYELLPAAVEVVVHADHPMLNRPVAGLLPPGIVEAFAPRAVGLCRFNGHLLCLPRNIDVRVLWYRTDLIDTPPATWDEVLASPHPFGFTGRESGLFGLFFELVAGAGAALFDEAGRPTMATPAALEAVETLCRLAATAPADLPEWHYDEVDTALLEGRVAMAAAWPGGTAAIRASGLAHRLAAPPQPAGPAR